MADTADIDDVSKQFGVTPEALRKAGYYPPAAPAAPPAWLENAKLPNLAGPEPTDTPSTPPPAPKKEFDVSKIFDELGELRREDLADRKALAEAQKPLYDAAAKSITQGMEERHAAFERMQERIKPPPLPQQVSDDMRGVAGLMAMVGGIFGAFGAHNATGAVNFMAGALKGYNDGYIQQSEMAAKQFQQQLDAVIASNKWEMDLYKDAKEMSEGDTNAYLNLIRLGAEQAQNKMLANEAAQKNLMTVAQVLDRQENTQLKLEQARDRSQMLVLQMEKLGMQVKDMREGELDMETMEGNWERWKAGDRTVFQNIGRGNQGSRNLAMQQKYFVMRMKEEGMSPQDIMREQRKMQALTAFETSQARTAGTRAANLEIISDNLEMAIPMAEMASDNVPRGKWVPINQLTQAAADQISDPNLRVFRMANLQLAELWARAMNPQGVMRESDREKALDLLSTAVDPATYKKQTAVLKAMVEREQMAVKKFEQDNGYLPDKPLTLPDPATGVAPVAGKPAAPAPAAAEGWGITKMPSAAPEPEINMGP
jgi:hypothetical protein